jgi:hypothetical protein
MLLMRAVEALIASDSRAYVSRAYVSRTYVCQQHALPFLTLFVFPHPKTLSDASRVFLLSRALARCAASMPAQTSRSIVIRGGGVGTGFFFA